MSNMSNNQYVSHKKFNVEDVEYHPTGEYASGGKFVALKYGKSNALKIRTPIMKTWGANKKLDFNDKETTKGYDMAFRFTSNGSKNVQSFLQKMKDLENKIIDDALANSKEWFGKQYKPSQREIIEEKFNRILKYPKKKDDSGELDYSKDPWFVAKFKWWDGAFDENLGLYHLTDIDEDTGKPKKLHNYQPDELGEYICDLIPKNSEVAAVLHVWKIWFVGGNFGATIRITQARVEPAEVNDGSSTFVFDDDEEDELEELRKRKLNKVKKKSVMVSDDEGDEYGEQNHQEEEEEEENNSEEDGGKAEFVDEDLNSMDVEDVQEEEEEEEVAEVVPEKPKKKKVVRRRKKTSA
mgnify:CR=1 FL=1